MMATEDDGLEYDAYYIAPIDPKLKRADGWYYNFRGADLFHGPYPTEADAIWAAEGAFSEGKIG